MDTEVICASHDPWRRRRLSAILHNAGFQVCTCGTAEELFEMAARWPRGSDADAPVLILDAQLSRTYRPSRVVAALRRDGVPVRTIILAARDHESEIIQCLREGADDFVHLPANPAEIVEVVCRVHALPDLV